MVSSFLAVDGVIHDFRRRAGHRIAGWRRSTSSAIAAGSLIGSSMRAFKAWWAICGRQVGLSSIGLVSPLLEGCPASFDKGSSHGPQPVCSECASFAGVPKLPIFAVNAAPSGRSIIRPERALRRIDKLSTWTCKTLQTIPRTTAVRGATVLRIDDVGARRQSPAFAHHAIR